MAETIQLRPGEKALIFSRSLSSVPMTYHFQATALDGEHPDGKVEIQGSHWIFRKPVLTQPLQLHNIVHAGFLDTFFKVSVIAHGDVTVTLPRGSLSGRWIVWLAALIIVAALVVFLLAR
jgi:hypothetical protein